MSTHRRKVSDSDRGSAPSAPDELEVPRPCGISIPGAAYQVELRLVLQLAMIRLTLEKGAYLYGAFQISILGIVRVIRDKER